MHKQDHISLPSNRQKTCTLFCSFFDPPSAPPAPPVYQMTLKSDILNIKCFNAAPCWCNSWGWNLKSLSAVIKLLCVISLLWIYLLNIFWKPSLEKSFTHRDLVNKINSWTNDSGWSSVNGTGSGRRASRKGVIRGVLYPRLSCFLFSVFYSQESSHFTAVVSAPQCLCWHSIIFTPG